MNKLIGQILLWLGFLSGALATVFATSTYSRMGMDLTTNLDEQVIRAGSRKGPMPTKRAYATATW